MAKINFINTVKRKCQIWKKNILYMQHSLVEPLFSIPSSFEQWLSRKPHPCVPTCLPDECVCTCMFIMKHTIPWANRRLCCLSNGWKKKKKHPFVLHSSSRCGHVLHNGLCWKLQKAGQLMEKNKKKQIYNPQVSFCTYMLWGFLFVPLDIY